MKMFTIIFYFYTLNEHFDSLFSNFLPYLNSAGVGSYFTIRVKEKNHLIIIIIYIKKKFRFKRLTIKSKVLAKVSLTSHCVPYR